MLKKIFETGVANLLNSFLSFLITFIIINKAGLEIVGEMYVFLANCSIIMLLNIFFPTTYSLIQIQKSQVFIKYLFSMYFYVQFLIILLSLSLLVFFYNFGLWSLAAVIYCCCTSWLNFYDILLQSKGLIKDFYFCTLIGSFIKVMALLFFVTSEVELMHLVSLLLLGQLVSLVFMFQVNRIKGRKVITNYSVTSLLNFYKSKFIYIRGFYLNAIFKRLFDNLPALVFGNVISSNSMGLFSIFQKCLVFGFSFVRIVESLLLTRLFSEMLTMNVKLITLLGSIVFTFFASVLYTYVTVGLMINYSFIVSLLIIPIFITMEIRTRYVKSLLMYHVNLGMILSMIVMFLCSVLPVENELNLIFIGYTMMLITQAFWLILNMKRKIIHE